MSKPINHIIVSVSNDLFSDQRVDKVCNTLLNIGFEVTLVGRKLPSSLPLSSRKYSTKRMKLLFTKGPLFYAELNFRLFWYLLFKKHSVLLANDLDTLLANYTVSKFRRTELVYDSHEYFTEVPELAEGSFAKNMWLRIERFIFPKLKNVYTVCNSISEVYGKKYEVDVKVVRNIPRQNLQTKFKTREELGLPKDKKILLLQGAGINIDRGSEEMVEAMKFLPGDYLFVIVGGGDVFDILKETIIRENLEEKVKIVGRVPYEELINYTFCADLGLSLDKNTNLNYQFSLPNKLFDYINYQTPVLTSNLIEIRNIVETYDVGWITNSHNPKEIAQIVLSIFENENQYTVKKNNTLKASEELNWENEEMVLKEMYSKLLK
ncbi:MAG: glycosyltransferase [Flavobacteriales bacterium]